MEKIISQLVDFLNAKLESDDLTGLMVDLTNYLTFSTHNSTKHSLPGLTEKMNQYDSLIKKPSDEELPSTLAEIQNHLKRLVDKIIKDLDSRDKTLLVKSLPGNYKVYLDPSGNKFALKFEPFQRLSDTRSLDLKNEKDLATLALFDLLMDNEIAPDQLGKCVGCGKYFFRPTRHRQLYCSQSCGASARARERAKKENRGG
jgi:hypothetical protein